MSVTVVATQLCGTYRCECEVLPPSSGSGRRSRLDRITWSQSFITLPVHLLSFVRTYGLEAVDKIEAAAAEAFDRNEAETEVEL